LWIEAVQKQPLRPHAKKKKKKKYIEVPFLLQVSNQSSSVDGKVFLQASIPNGTHFWDLKKKNGTVN
jgi:hypothetical protein